eukprot:363597-Chlamydomonas_euryale.AAC.13
MLRGQLRQDRGRQERLCVQHDGAVQPRHTHVHTSRAVSRCRSRAADAESPNGPGAGAAGFARIGDGGGLARSA